MTNHVKAKNIPPYNKWISSYHAELHSKIIMGEVLPTLFEVTILRPMGVPPPAQKKKKYTYTEIHMALTKLQ